jgi:phosphoribosylformimino-5-aminoimidazole carboxamide ribonucleotide (ProFAR) isomerase
MQVGGGVKRASHINDIVKQSLNAWTFGGNGENTMNKFNQMKCLREYL